MKIAIYIFTPVEVEHLSTFLIYIKFNFIFYQNYINVFMDFWLVSEFNNDVDSNVQKRQD